MIQLPGDGLTLSKQLTDPIMKTESLRTSAVVNLKSIKSSLSSGNSVWEGGREGGRKWRGGREGGRKKGIERKGYSEPLSLLLTGPRSS